MADQKKVNIYALAEANNQLALKLHKHLASTTHENLFFSPISISASLAMLFHGAGGKCSEEMRKVLGYDASNVTDGQIAICFSNFIQDLKSSHPYLLKLATANLMLIDKKRTCFKERYKIDLKIFFRALVKEVDFVKDSQKVIAEVNDHVKESTNNAITRVIQSLDPETVMLVMSAICFKGIWFYQFEKHWTYPQMFYNHGKEDDAKEIPMMHIKQFFPFLQRESFKALLLPYRVDNVAMMILLPRSRTGLAELESKLNCNFLCELERNMFLLKVEVALPKFTMECSSSLKNVLQKIGLQGIFSCGSDFSGLSDAADLAVSDIVHKATFEVDEAGSETTSLTTLSYGYCVIDTPVFTVDHPFLFVILDSRKNLILFMGKVEQL